MKLKKGDTVYITKGKDRGQTGKVLSVFPHLKKIIVEKINIKKRHVRPKRSGEKGQVIEIPGKIQAANAQLLCSNCNKAARVGYEISENGKGRICKKCKGNV